MKDKILKLKEEGYSQREIAKQLNISRTLVQYYSTPGEKEKNKQRRLVHYHLNQDSQNNRAKNWRRSRHPFFVKIDRFRNHHHKNEACTKQDFTIDEVIAKFENNHICYLTGRSIDLTKTASYHFDHILPKSRGGDNSLSNLELATKEANQAKSNMTKEEFLQLCKDTLEHNGFKVEYLGIEPKSLLQT